uniref:Uncharacterized protein n=1 Tax=Knipowitschia caucasica TaxID=637954 RepID=A0AAV2KWX5_KNICA
MENEKKNNSPNITIRSDPAWIKTALDVTQVDEKVTMPHKVLSGPGTWTSEEEGSGWKLEKGGPRADDVAQI